MKKKIGLNFNLINIHIIFSVREYNSKCEVFFIFYLGIGKEGT